MLWLSSVQANHNNASCTFGDADHRFADTNLLILQQHVPALVLRAPRGPQRYRHAERGAGGPEPSRLVSLLSLQPLQITASTRRIRAAAGSSWSGIDAVKTSLPLRQRAALQHLRQENANAADLRVAPPVPPRGGPSPRKGRPSGPGGCAGEQAREEPRPHQRGLGARDQRAE